MFRITIRGELAAETGTARLILEGKLIGEGVSELEKIWAATCDSAGARAAIQVDCSALSFISNAGAALLYRMTLEGALLIAKTPLMSECIQDICRSRAWTQTRISGARRRSRNSTLCSISTGRYR